MVCVCVFVCLCLCLLCECIYIYICIYVYLFLDFPSLLSPNGGVIGIYIYIYWEPHNGGKTAIIHFKNGGAGASALGRAQGPLPPFCVFMDVIFVYLLYLCIYMYISPYMYVYLCIFNRLLDIFPPSYPLMGGCIYLYRISS